MKGRYSSAIVYQKLNGKFDMKCVMIRVLYSLSLYYDKKRTSPTRSLLPWE